MNATVALRAIIVSFMIGIGGTAMALELSSPAFEEGQDIPAEFSCEGADLSPELSWSGAPVETKSYVLIMDDPDAPVGTWVHWVVYDIPDGVLSLGKGAPKTKTLENGAKQGITSFRSIGYGGPCPPPGPKHRYYFKLYALDTLLDLPHGKTKQEIEQAMQGHILDQAQLMGRYGR